MNEEEFFAWLDGELDVEAAARIAAIVAADPEWQAKADAHREMQSNLRHAFDPVMAAPVPDRIGAAPVDFAAARARRDERRQRGRLPLWASVAATLVIGVGLGSIISRGEPSPVELQGGRMIAASALRTALDTQLASNGAAAGRVDIGLTFRNRDGAVCRSFADAGSSGLACRDGQDWVVQGLFGTKSEGQGDYRMAAGEDPRLAGLIDESIAGEPFDAVAERTAQQRGWR